MPDTPIRALIVDDEPFARTRVRKLLEDTNGRFVVVAEATDGQSAVEAALKKEPEVIFLDIKLPDLDGFEVLAALETNEPYSPSAIVFVTGYDRYAVRAFEANAVDYLLKPIEEERFNAAVARIHGRLRQMPPSSRPPSPARATLTRGFPPERRYLTRLVVPNRGRVFVVPVEDVETLAAMDNYVAVATGTRTFLLRSGLAELADNLDPSEFIRVHRSYAVALRHVRELRARAHGGYDIVMVSGHIVRASRAHREALQRLLARLEAVRH